MGILRRYDRVELATAIHNVFNLHESVTYHQEGQGEDYGSYNNRCR